MHYLDANSQAGIACRALHNGVRFVASLKD